MSNDSRDNVQIPVIDISNADHTTGHELVEAVAKYGFVFIRAHGTDFTSDLVDGMFGLARHFFQSPYEEKAACAITANNRGWSSMHSETLDPEHQRKGDFKEALNLGEFTHGKAQQPVPKSLAAHEAELSHFADLCHNLCLNLLKLFALGLKIDDEEGGQDWFASRHDPSKGASGSILRLLHYPSIPECGDYKPEIDVRAGAHSDYGTVTLLFQRRSQPGLEILTPTSTWSPVPVTPPGTEHDALPPILVNIGDLLSYWTKGLLKSTVHRVVFPEESRREGQDRYSIAYFCHPSNETELVPVPSELVRGYSGQEECGATEGRRLLTAREHLSSRLEATYGWAQQAEPA